MRINIRQSNLFTKSPDHRFSREYDVPYGTWTDIWRRYKLLDYSVQDIIEFVEFKFHRTMSKKSVQRWIWRSEIYSLAVPAINKGAQVVDSSYFREFEQSVVEELTKNR